MWLGDYTAGDTIDFKFTTRTTSGAPTTLSGSPTLCAYKTNSTTESTAGITLTVDFDTLTGQNHVRITTGSDTTFYADGNDYEVTITAGTVGGTSVVGEVVAAFSLRNRASDLGIYRGSVTGAATTTTLIDSSLTQSDTDFWKGRSIIFISGALKGEASNITAFTPASDQLTFGTLSNAPSAADIYLIV